jgi:hypothetical protein
MKINVAFTDASETTVLGCFGSPQSLETWPYQAQIEATDKRWAAYYNSLPEGMRSGLPTPD